jgi:hypothetical protein
VHQPAHCSPTSVSNLSSSTVLPLQTIYSFNHYLFFYVSTLPYHLQQRRQQPYHTTIQQRRQQHDVIYTSRSISWQGFFFTHFKPQVALRTTINIDS